MSIDTTVIPHIRQMLQRVARGESINFDDHDLAVLGARIADAIDRAFKGRMPRDRSKEKALYFSELGSPCHRKVWYKFNGTEGEELQPAALVKFMYGDILEELALFLAEQAGCEVTERQGERSLDIGDGWVVRGRIDAVIDGQLVDVKSASTPSFNKIVNGKLSEDDAFGYLSQLYGYWVATPEGHEAHSNHPGFFVIDKTLGTIGVGCYAAEMGAEEVHDKVVAKGQQLRDDVLKSTPPDRAFEPKPDGKSGNMKLATNCSYCPYKHECWKDANNGKGLRTFFYSNGPRFLTTVANEPNVPEQT